MTKLPTSQSLVSSLQSLQTLADVWHTQNPKPVDLLVTTASKVLQNSGSMLRVLIDDPETHATESIHLLTSILLHTMGLVIPLIGTTKHASALDQFVGSLSSKILVPVMRSFRPLTLSHFKHTFDRTNSLRKVDLRSHLLRLFRDTIDGFQSTKATVETLLTNCREQIILETIREIDKEMVGSQPVISPSNSRGDRVRMLATKDALWYLITIAHILFEPTSAIHASKTILDDVVIQALANLVGLRRPQDTVSEPIIRDDVVQNMILALVERAGLGLPAQI